MNDTDLHDLIGSAFGDGPPPPAPVDRLGPARRALRRRRLASAGGVAATVAAVLTTATVLGSGGGAAPRAVEPAGGATSAPTTADSSPPSPSSTPAPADASTGPAATEPAVPLSELRTCLEAVAGFLDASPEALNDAMLTYDPVEGVLRLPQEDVRADIYPTGDPARMECSIDGVPVETAGRGEGAP